MVAIWVRDLEAYRPPMIFKETKGRRFWMFSAIVVLAWLTDRIVIFFVRFRHNMLLLDPC